MLLVQRMSELTLLPSHQYTREEVIGIGSSSSTFNPLVLRSDVKVHFSFLTVPGDLWDGDREVDTNCNHTLKLPWPHLTRCQNDFKLSTILEELKSAEKDAEEHDVPFDELLEALQPSDKELRAIQSLFQVRVFNVVDVNAQTLDAARCDWTIYVEQTKDSKRLLPLRLRVIYNTVSV